MWRGEVLLRMENGKEKSGQRYVCRAYTVRVARIALGPTDRMRADHGVAAAR